MYGFDPSYGYSKEQLLQVDAPRPPRDFAAFWQSHYRKALRVAPRPKIRDTNVDLAGWRVFDLSYHSTCDVKINGWLTIPSHGVVERAFVVGHGYGGREEPDFHLQFSNAAVLYPCFRGISRSAQRPFSDDPNWHVLHDIHNPRRYVLRGCVEDIWLGVSALTRLFPQVEQRIGYLGISFGGGIGAIATAFDDRIRRCHFNVPSFGNQALRLRLPTHGSGASVQKQFKRYPRATLKTLRYYDAAIAARYLQQPAHVACALYDPYVAPPGQFAIYNALPGPKQLFTLQAGHHEYAERPLQDAALMRELRDFFADL